MGYGHAERNLAAVRQLEAETRELIGNLRSAGSRSSSLVGGGYQPRKTGGCPASTRNGNGASGHLKGEAVTMSGKAKSQTPGETALKVETGSP
jgi:hypothetical protein